MDLTLNTREVKLPTRSRRDSSMTVLLINIPLSDRHESDSGQAHLNFPLGLAYIAGSIRQAGYRLHVVDMSVARMSCEELENHLRTLTMRIDVIGFGNMITAYVAIEKVARACKRIFPHAPIICGGSAISSEPRLLLERTLVDIGVMNEGENTIVEVLEALEAGSELSRVSGIWYKEEGQVKSTAPRDEIKALDGIAPPAWDLFDTETYVRCNKKITSKRDLPIITSRGCPFTCKFCYRNFGDGWRVRSVESVLDEIAYLKKWYGLEWVSLWDELFLTNKKWAEQFAMALLDRRMSIGWTCVTRASFIKERDLPLLRLLRKAGLRRLSMGIESGSQTILDAMDKKVKVAEMENAIRLVRDAHIKATGSFIIGYPGENRLTVWETVSFGQCNLVPGAFYYCAPYPGTPLWEQVVSKGLIPDKEMFIRGLSDASKMAINLSEVSDEDLAQLKVAAEDAMNRISFKRHWHYYKAQRAVSEAAKTAYYNVRNHLCGYYFDTP